jgi:type II secretory pathway component GspD/PulD (secretin)
MSRRRIVVAAGAAMIAAVGLAIIVPGYFSPIPGVVAELRSCLEPTNDAPDSTAPDVRADEMIHIELIIAGFNTTRAGGTLLADGERPGRVVSGVVRHSERFQTALQRLQSEQCIEIHSKPAVATLNAQNFYISVGSHIPVVSTDNGVATVEYKLHGNYVDGMAILCKDGRISLQLQVMRSELIEDAGTTTDNPEFDVVEAKASIVLRVGQTGFIGGIRHKARWTEEYSLPLVSELPGIGSWFHFRHQADIEEEVLIFATPRAVLDRE